MQALRTYRLHVLAVEQDAWLLNEEAVTPYTQAECHDLFRAALRSFHTTGFDNDDENQNFISVIQWHSTVAGCSRDLAMEAVTTHGMFLLVLVRAAIGRAMEAHGHGGSADAPLDLGILDEELCLAAVRTTPTALRYVPPSLHSAVVCLAAVAGNGAALVHVRGVGVGVWQHGVVVVGAEC